MAPVMRSVVSHSSTNKRYIFNVLQKLNYKSSSIATCSSKPSYFRSLLSIPGPTSQAAKLARPQGNVASLRRGVCAGVDHVLRHRRLHHHGGGPRAGGPHWGARPQAHHSSSMQILVLPLCEMQQLIKPPQSPTHTISSAVQVLAEYLETMSTCIERRQESTQHTHVPLAEINSPKQMAILLMPRICGLLLWTCGLLFHSLFMQYCSK